MNEISARSRVPGAGGQRTKRFGGPDGNAKWPSIQKGERACFDILTNIQEILSTNAPPLPAAS